MDDQRDADAGPVLVTGANGFVGSFLVPALVALGHDVVALRKPGTPAGPGQCEWLDADLRDADATRAAFRQAKPGAVIHLAALAFPPDAASAPEEALRLNYGAVGNVARALRECRPHARLLFVSTGQVYGGRPVDAPPLDERAELHPETLYASTKVAAERMLELLCERDGLDVVRVRPFNHSGPGRPGQYAEASFARQLVAIERGEAQPVLRVGNLDAVRDYADVRDIVQAYALLLARGESGAVYNAGSGQARFVREVVDHLVSRTRVAVRVEVDPARVRPIPPERQALVADCSRLRALGWVPSYRFEDTLDAVLDDWRGRGSGA